MGKLVELLALVVVGAMAGSEFAVAAFLHPILGRLPDEVFRSARIDSGQLLGRVMPWWYLASLALLVAAAVAADSQRWVIGTGAGLLAVVVLLTVAVLVPINNRIVAWRATGAVSRALAGRWDRLHWLRVATLASIVALLVIGVLNG